MGREGSAAEPEAYWDRPGLASALREALAEAGLDGGMPTIEALAPFDQFHAGGLAFTRRLASLGGLTAGARVLDVGGGLGGPARTLAAEFGCQVTVVDLAPSYVEAGRHLTRLTGLEDRVSFVVGDALALPMPAGGVDVVWTQNSGMNIPDKASLYAGFRRLLGPGGRLVTQEPMAGPIGPPILPVMWADEPSTSHLRSPAEMRATIAEAGFRELAWEQVATDHAQPQTMPPERSVQGLVMGAERLEAIMRASRRNEVEDRVVLVHAVFEVAL